MAGQTRPRKTDHGEQDNSCSPTSAKACPTRPSSNGSSRSATRSGSTTPLVSMETAKAVVEVPSPVSGKVLKLAGGAGDVIVTGTMLAEFEVDPSLPQRAEGQDTGHHHGAPATQPQRRRQRRRRARTTRSSPPTKAARSAMPARPRRRAQPDGKRDDAGTVVGAMQSSDAVRSEAAVAVGGVKAMPAVRALARKLGVDLARVRATGADGVVTMDDVKRAAADGSAQGRRRAGRARAPNAPPRRRAATVAAAHARCPPAGKPMRTQPPGVAASGQPEQLKGVRRNMARVMADAHAQGRADHAVRRRRPARLDRQAGHHRAPDPRDRRRLQGGAGAQRLVRRRQADAHAASARRHRHRGRHRRRPVRAGAAQRRHARRRRRARRDPAPARAGRGPQHPGHRN